MQCWMLLAEHSEACQSAASALGVPSATGFEAMSGVLQPLGSIPQGKGEKARGWIRFREAGKNLF